MEAPKRKYKKHKTESKISVKHYLNTKLKGVQVDGTTRYPLYVQVTYKGKTSYVKSRYDLYETIENFDKVLKIYSTTAFLTEKTLIEDSILRKGLFDVEDINLQGWISPIQTVNENFIHLIEHKLKFAVATADSTGSADMMNDKNRTFDIENLNKWQKEVTLISYSKFVKIINWKFSDLSSFVETLRIVFPNNEIINEIQSQIPSEGSFKKLYDTVCTSHFIHGAFIADWQSGAFERAFKDAYEDNAPNWTVQYLNLYKSLITEYNNY